MILYFSGTGNSAYAAQRLGRRLGEEALDLFDRLRSHDTAALHSETPWVIVTPTYGWRIPRFVHSWLRETPLTGNRTVYFAMTCGGNIANAGQYLQALCADKELAYAGCLEIVMPENYIALFRAPDRQKALQIIGEADKVIDNAAALIRAGRPFPDGPVTLGGKISSGVVNDLFYPLFVHDRKFLATDACIACGQCERLCPLGNIRMEGGRPVWGGRCTHCMACICRCPREAIEYGKGSRGKLRYTCPKTAD